MMNVAVLFRALAGAAAVLASLANAATFFQTSGQPYDYILGGQQRSFSVANGAFLVTSNGTNGVQIAFSGSSSFWTFGFSNAPGQTLGVGTYDRTRRYPFNSGTHPGLDVSGEGRGCNTSAGRFVVHEIVRATDGTITSFAADFEQHCETFSPALLGGIRIN